MFSFFTSGIWVFTICEQFLQLPYTQEQSWLYAKRKVGLKTRILYIYAHR